MKKLLAAILFTAIASGNTMAAAPRHAPVPPPPPAPVPAHPPAPPPTPAPAPPPAPEPAPPATASQPDESDSDSPDRRIRMLPYSDDDVYTITTKYGYQTNIVFGKGEEIQTISVGDRSLWQLIPAGNRLFIRPMEYGMKTNMTLLTNKHSYQFDLKSVADEKSGGNIYVARFTYTDDTTGHMAKMSPGRPVYTLAQPMPARSAVAQPAAPAQASMQPESTAGQPSYRQSSAMLPVNPNYNYNYTYAGPDNAAPVRAYDDGKSTYIEYREDQPLPSVYILDAGGHAQPVSYNVDNNVVVINTVAGEWQLEENNGTVHLYNEMLNPK